MLERRTAAIASLLPFILCATSFAGVKITYEIRGPSSPKTSHVQYFTPMKSRIEMKSPQAGSLEMNSVILIRLDQKSMYYSSNGSSFKKVRIGERGRDNGQAPPDLALMKNLRLKKLEETRSLVGCNTAGYEITANGFSGTVWLCASKKLAEVAQYNRNLVAIHSKSKSAPEMRPAELRAMRKLTNSVPLELEGEFKAGAYASRFHMVATSVKNEDFDDSFFEPIAREDDDIALGEADQNQTDAEPAPIIRRRSAAARPEEAYAASGDDSASEEAAKPRQDSLADEIVKETKADIRKDTKQTVRNETKKAFRKGVKSVLPW